MTFQIFEENKNSRKSYQDKKNEVYGGLIYHKKNE